MDKSHLACLVGGAALASAFFWGLQTRENKKEQQKIDVDSQHYHTLKQEQLARIIKYFGDDKFKTMENSYVMVLGVGGVGSHVVNMLARSGVKKIKVVDFDRVTLSSLNRHSCAARKDVGSSKVETLKRYISEILPHITIETVQAYVTVENASQLLTQDLSYVVDCIDNLDAKVEVVRVCKTRGLKLICSGGAGMKCDPTRLQIRDISDCKYDGLITRLRRDLLKHNIKGGIKVAFSYQPAEKELLPLQEHQEKDPQKYRVFDNYRLRIVPVLGPMPAILGMAIASYVLCDLAGEPYQPHQTDYVKSTAINKLYNQFMAEQRKRTNPIKDMPIDMEEVSILAKEIYKWRSLLSGKKEASQRLSRWDPTKPPLIDNLALFCKGQHQKHSKFKTLQEAGYSEQIQSRFEEKAKRAKGLLESGHLMFI